MGSGCEKAMATPWSQERRRFWGWGGGVAVDRSDSMSPASPPPSSTAHITRRRKKARGRLGSVGTVYTRRVFFFLRFGLLAQAFKLDFGLYDL